MQFATKPRLAAEMINAALDAQLTASWVTGDEAYGQGPQLRAALEARGIGYVKHRRRLPGSGTAPSMVRRARAPTTGPGSTSAPAAVAIC